MTLPDLLPIQPFTQPVAGGADLPGSKSITNRALLLAALCDGPVTLTGALFSEDTKIMSEALRRLGFEVEEDESAKTIRVEGRGGTIPAEKAEIFVGNAGTAARFLTALCAAAPRGSFKIDGVAQMRKRPMKGLIDALRGQGADIRCLQEEGFFPIEINSHGLKGGVVRIDASASSQMLSAMMMVAPLSSSEQQIKLTAAVREPFVEMTRRLGQSFGQTKGRYHLKSGIYPIEPDATAASYFLALPLATGGSLKLPHLHVTQCMLQGDLRFVDVLRKMGVMISELDDGSEVHFDRSVRGRGVSENFNEFSDTFLTLAALAPLLEGPTRITGIAHTRKQETDRVAGAARELKKLGQEVIEADDSLEIHPQPLRSGQTIETYGDHRFAMSFAVLGSHNLHGDGRPWLSIRDPACCAKTFPNFFDVLDSLRPKPRSSR